VSGVGDKRKPQGLTVRGWPFHGTLRMEKSPEKNCARGGKPCRPNHGGAFLPLCLAQKRNLGKRTDDRTKGKILRTDKAESKKKADCAAASDGFICPIHQGDHPGQTRPKVPSDLGGKKKPKKIKSKRKDFLKRRK